MCGCVCFEHNALLFPCRILEKEIQALKKNHEVEIKQLNDTLESLKKDNDRQQEIIGQVCALYFQARLAA